MPPPATRVPSAPGLQGALAKLGLTPSDIPRFIALKPFRSGGGKGEGCAAFPPLFSPKWKQKRKLPNRAPLCFRRNTDWGDVSRPHQQSHPLAGASSDGFNPQVNLNPHVASFPPHSRTRRGNRYFPRRAHRPSARYRPVPSWGNRAKPALCAAGEREPRSENCR